jgi:signal transduction histidine kinase
LVKTGMVDSAVFAAYPSLPRAPAADTATERGDWRTAQLLEERRNFAAAIAVYANIATRDADVALAARAAQGAIRCLLRLPDHAAAASMILQFFSAGRLVKAADLQGRMISADEYLLALRLSGAKGRGRAAIVERLVGWLNDYAQPIPSSQRLFLMSELVAMGVPPERFPTYEAERLAAQVLETGTVTAGAGLESTRVPELWTLTAKGGRVVALLRTASVMDSTRAVLKETGANPGVSFQVIPPGAVIKQSFKPPNEAIAAGPMLPGWQLGFTLESAGPMEEASRRRRTAYLWVGYVVIASMTIVGLLLGRTLRRQLRLARMKTDLVAAVSHELKTPLASMRLLVDSLLEDRELDFQKTREYLALIAGENLRLTRLIENFLTFSRIERNRQHFEFGAADAASIVRTAANSVRERFDQPACRLDLAIESNLPEIHVDSDALVTVLINLLDNAYKYTPGEKRITLRAFREAESVILAVEDNGIGIEPHDQKRIFRKFYRVDQRLARETGGCGLGLSIVEFIVRAHGGSVRVTSRPGAGSTFSVVLPCREPARRAAA